MYRTGRILRFRTFLLNNERNVVAFIRNQKYFIMFLILDIIQF